MKYLDEYRNPELIRSIVKSIHKTVTRPWHIMEICGGQTHAIARYRLEEMLSPDIHLLHGPGCPVCITSEQIIDQAIELSKQPDIILASFGDMMRVPGSEGDLLTAKAQGADIRILYSPLDAIQIATNNPDKQIAFFAIGFETTIPVHLATLREAIRRKLTNVKLLTSFYTVPSAIEAILSDPECNVNGFLTAGHVCSITGNKQYHPIAQKHKIPMTVTGFEPADLLYGIYRCIQQLESGTHLVENAYKRVVTDEGNPKAIALIEEMLEPCDQEWRGIGIIPNSGLKLRREYDRYTIKTKMHITPDKIKQTSSCIAGKIMRGIKQPADCLNFGTNCRPSHPLGAPMVSSEGACAAYYKYK